MSDISASPLTWPISQPRVASHARVSSRFKASLAESRTDLLHELSLLGARDVVISSNLELRRDGLPYADSREPSDPGVAVYFSRKVAMTLRPFVIACDSYTRTAHNLRAVGVTVGALRTIARHGASSMLEQAFTGFAALPPAGGTKFWWEILGVERSASLREIQGCYLDLVQIHHPDKEGGSHERMSEINEAFRQAKEEKR
jgi:DnaJ-like protein